VTDTGAAKTLANVTSLEWEEYEGMHLAYSETGAHVIEIGALQERGQAHKWGEEYRPGRSWTVFHEDGRVITGRANNLPAARKATIFELEQGS